MNLKSIAIVMVVVLANVSFVTLLYLQRVPKHAVQGTPFGSGCTKGALWLSRTYEECLRTQHEFPRSIPAYIAKCSAGRWRGFVLSRDDGIALLMQGKGERIPLAWCPVAHPGLRGEFRLVVCIQGQRDRAIAVALLKDRSASEIATEAFAVTNVKMSESEFQRELREVDAALNREADIQDLAVGP